MATLSEAQVNRVWERMWEAEVRSLYFGDLAATYTKRKQVITGLSFLLSSGAAATAAAHASWLFPLTTSGIAAILNGYSIAVGIDRKAAVMAKLHTSWNQLRDDYERLWNHWFEDDAEAQFEALQKRERDASETGSTEAPYDVPRIEKWTHLVYDRYERKAA
jgi:hypothetical protein